MGAQSSQVVLLEKRTRAENSAKFSAFAVPYARRAKHGAAHGRRSGAVASEPMEARALLARGQAGAARGTPAVPPASPIDRSRARGRRSRPHQLNVRLLGGSRNSERKNPTELQAPRPARGLFAGSLELPAYGP